MLVPYSGIIENYKTILRHHEIDANYSYLKADSKHDDLPEIEYNDLTSFAVVVKSIQQYLVSTIPHEND